MLVQLTNTFAIDPQAVMCIEATPDNRTILLVFRSGRITVNAPFADVFAKLNAGPDLTEAKALATDFINSLKDSFPFPAELPLNG